MSFHLTAQEIELRDGHILHARLQREDGGWQESEIDLDQFIGNQDGCFCWGGANFSESAEECHFAIEGGADVPVLRAQLRCENGEMCARDVNLAERVFNRDGSFVFGKAFSNWPHRDPD
ncbi:Cyanovirin-N [Xylariomycetidae sp. FL0641]|nr:Cyanovirin-N [Xylariomycetidae sp. FL0641]